MNPKMYLISEDELLRLLAAELELNQLEASGVDNWSWYGEGRKEFLLNAINNRVPKDELPEDIDFEYVALLDIKNYELLTEDDLK
jgi:hypothetical protein